MFLISGEILAIEGGLINNFDSHGAGGAGNHFFGGF
jgi:hypothetical protein